MKLCALDLETTGLDPQVDQILQIGTVLFDPETKTRHEFMRYVRHKRYSGDAYALAMNAEILKCCDKDGIPLSRATADLAEFLVRHNFGNPNHAVGFNVQSFDVAFIHKAREGVPLFHHRGIELGTLLMGAFGKSTPVTSSWAVSEWLGTEVKHDALRDAHDAASLYMEWYDKANDMEH